MVKILDLNNEEMKERERLSKLVQIAKEVFPQAKVSTLENHYNYLSVNLQEGTISVHLLGGREIYANSKFLLYPAVRLAEAYEKNSEGEFTVKKQYLE